MMIYLVCYDVSDDKERLNLADVLLEYGERVQLSVFEVALGNVSDLSTLTTRLRDIAAADTNIRMYRLCKDCRSKAQDVDGHTLPGMPAVVIV